MLELWNGGELDLVEEVYASDCVRGDGRPLRPDDVREGLVLLREAFPDQDFTVEDELQHGAKVVMCLRWSGSHRGRFVTPLGTIEATGRKFSVSGIEIFEVRADRVTRVSLAWDMVQLLSQLGVRLTSA